MRRTTTSILALIALLGLLAPVTPVPVTTEPAETGVYVEDFSTYTAKDYTEDTVWDIWMQALRLARLDSVNQEYPAVAVDGNGNAIVVWTDDRDGNGDIYMQKTDGNGNRLWANDMRVNSESGIANQNSPAVAVDGNGNAIVVWTDDRNGNGDIYVQKLDRSGSKLWAADLRVNSESGAYQVSPAVAIDGSGNAVIVWMDNRNGNYDIYAQRLDGSGNPIWATDVRVNSDVGTADQLHPVVAVNESGNVIVVWEDHRNGDDCDIYAQRLDVNGNKIWDTDVRVNSDTGTDYQEYPAVAMDESGNSIVVWYDFHGANIYAQWLDRNSGKLWPADVRVNSNAGTAQQVPAVAADGNGNAFVVWVDKRNGDADIYAQTINKNGNLLWAMDIQVNSGSKVAWRWSRPDLAVDGMGNAFVVWDGRRGITNDIYIQRLDRHGNKCFADIRVNYEGGTAWQSYPALTADSNGNILAVWQDGRNDDYNIYTQRIDNSGNHLWFADVQINETRISVPVYPIAVTNGNDTIG